MDDRAGLYRRGEVLFSARGFRNTSVSDIMAMAGMSAGTFCNYHPSKEKLFMEICLEADRKLTEAMLKSPDPDGQPARY